MYKIIIIQNRRNNKANVCSKTYQQQDPLTVEVSTLDGIEQIVTNTLWADLQTCEILILYTLSLT